MPRRLKIGVGDKVGRLTILEVDKKVTKEKGRTYFKCVCECGKVKIIRASHIANGSISSCGCYNKEVVKTIVADKKRRHIITNKRIFGIWSHMKNRCNNENSHHYSYYGGRGIKVCDEWLNSYESFEKWSLENGYDKTLSVDRIDVNKGYCPSNCRWADIYTQSNNKTNNKFIKFNGETKTVKQWARQLNVNYGTLMYRYNNKLDVKELLMKEEEN